MPLTPCYPYNMADDEYISTTQAAKILGVTKMTIGRWIKQGKLSAIMVANNWIIPVAAVRALADSLHQHQTPGSTLQDTVLPEA